MIFLTIGTLFPFGRLIKAVDEAVGEGLIDEQVFAQIGNDSYKPRHINFVEKLSKGVFDRTVTEASMLISHAGIGSITSALSRGKPLLVMPRLKRFGEHVNDHQVGTARKFEELGHVLVAYDTDELPAKIRQLKTFTPKPRVSQADKVARRIAEFLDDLGS